MLTYAQALAVTDPLTLEATILADIAGQGVDLTGYDDFSTPKAQINEQGRARNAEQLIRSILAQTVDPLALALLSTDWVDVVCRGAYQEPRLHALATIGTVVVSVAYGSGPYTYSAGDILIQDVATGAYFTNANTAAQGAATSAAATMPFTAQTPGAASNPVGSPTFKLISAPSGKSLGLSFGSWVRTQAGADAEGNIAFVTRCQAKWGTLGAGGNVDAYNYWIPTGTPAIAKWYVDDSNPGGEGTTYVYLADAAGPATVGEISSVQAYLTARRALGSGLVTAFAAPAFSVPFSAQLLQDGSNGSAVANAGAAIALLQAALPLGAIVDAALVIALLRGMPMATADIALTAGGSKVVQVGALGFGGVVGLVSESLSLAGVSVPKGNVATLSASIT